MILATWSQSRTNCGKSLMQRGVSFGVGVTNAQGIVTLDLQIEEKVWWSSLGRAAINGGERVQV
jgi:hypothetical protein